MARGGNTDVETFTSVTAALDAIHMPLENRPLIEQFCRRLGITLFEKRSNYINAIRPDGGAALQIQYGWTNGFTSQAEVKSLAEDAKTYWKRQRRTGLWCVAHPINRLRDGAVTGHKTP